MDYRVDVHWGRIAIQRLILKRQPWVILHDHGQEAARLTGPRHEKIKRTFAFSWAQDRAELAIVGFDPLCPANAQRRRLGRPGPGRTGAKEITGVNT